MNTSTPSFLGIAIAAIEVPPRLRAIDPDAVASLAANIAAHGLMQPIVVRTVAEEPGRLILVAGAHRLAAVTRLGWSHVRAEVVEADELQARLLEIDENLVRRDLSALDKGRFLAERKRVYEELHPESARPGRRGNADKMSAISFAAEIAGRMGNSERHIRRLIALFEALDPAVRDVIALTPAADNASELKALGKLPPARQRAVADRLAEGSAKRVSAALDDVTPRPLPSPVDAQFLALLKAWNRAGDAARTKFRAHIDAEAED